MPRVSNILVPIDIHENAVPIVQWAALFARAASSQLTLLHVNESLEFLKDRPGLRGGGLSSLDMTLDTWRQHYQQDTRAMLESLAQQYCHGLSVSPLILEGRAHATILGAIETTRSDLVIMGTHGRPWYQRVFLGSTAEAVLRASAVPTLIIHNGESSLPPPRMRRMLTRLEMDNIFPTIVAKSTESVFHLQTSWQGKCRCRFWISCRVE